MMPHHWRPLAHERNSLLIFDTIKLMKRKAWKWDNKNSIKNNRYICALKLFTCFTGDNSTRLMLFQVDHDCICLFLETSRFSVSFLLVSTVCFSFFSLTPPVQVVSIRFDVHIYLNDVIVIEHAINCPCSSVVQILFDTKCERNMFLSLPLKL